MTSLNENWAVGKHSAWERALHRARSSAKSQGKTLTAREEHALIDRFYQNSPRDAEELVSCEICIALIEEAMLAGRSAFDCPPEVKKQIEAARCRAALMDLKKKQEYLKV